MSTAPPKNTVSAFCNRCQQIDFDKVLDARAPMPLGFSLSTTEFEGSQNDDNCPVCRLFAAVAHAHATKDYHLRAFSLEPSFRVQDNTANHLNKTAITVLPGKSQNEMLLWRQRELTVRGFILAENRVSSTLETIAGKN